MNTDRRQILKTVGASVGAGAVAAGGSGTAAASPVDDYIQAHYTDYSSMDRSVDDINWIVCHVPVMSYESTRNYIGNNNDRNVSYHAVVSNYEQTEGEPGEITQFVDWTDKAHHAQATNASSIGISHEWHSDLGGYFTDACYQASAELIRYLADTFDIPLEYYDSRTCVHENAEGGIIGHKHTPTDYECTGYAADYKTCPGPDWEPQRLMEFVNDGSSGGGGGDGGSGDQFQEGDEVVSTTDLNGRHRPNLDSEVLTVLSEGMSAEIVNGPELNDGYTWWGLYVTSAGEWVWCVEQYLALANNTEPDPPSVAVSTDSASGVGETSATLNATVTDLQNADTADLYFEYGESGGSLSNTTDVTTISGAVTVDATISGLSAGTTYDYRVVAEAGEASDSGSTQSFTTDESSTGGCFITTATARDVGTLNSLRRFRDQSMAATHLGRGMVGLYYRISPPIAETLNRHPESRTARMTRSIIQTCAGLSDRQDATDSSLTHGGLAIVLTVLYVVGILVAAGGHAAIRTGETLS
jgi:hypothetical protein